MKTLREVAIEADKIMAPHNEGAAMDAGFDGGEFSGPAHGRMEEREITELAEANGFTLDDVFGELHVMAYEELAAEEQAAHNARVRQEALAEGTSRPIKINGAYFID